VVIRRFDTLYKEGQSGQAKLTQYTRYLTIGLAVLQSTTIIATARSGALFNGCEVGNEIIQPDNIVTVVLMIITMTAGTGVIMWLGELISQHGVGNGMSLLIFTSIIAAFPASMGSILGGGGNSGVTKFLIVVALFVLVIFLIVFVEQSQRRIPVQYAKKVVGRKTYGGSTTYLPIKINMSGVIPVIFASSLLAMPTMISYYGKDTSAWVQFIRTWFGQTAWTYNVLYALLIIFFAYFYVAITYNPDDVADNMKKYGGFVPGIRAGRPTAEYLDYVITRILAVGSLYLAFVALIPTIAFLAMEISSSVPFGGSSLLIVVGVGLETVKQIEAQLQQRHYEGFLR
jgi:preprotein translocase subunit SecY